MWGPFVVFGLRLITNFVCNVGSCYVSHRIQLAHLETIRVYSLDHNWRIKSVFYWYGQPNRHEAGA